MSSAKSPSDLIKDVMGDDAEITRLMQGNLAVSIDQNRDQTLVTVAMDDVRAVITVDEPELTEAGAIEAAHDMERGLDRLRTAPFGGDHDV